MNGGRYALFFSTCDAPTWSSMRIWFGSICFAFYRGWKLARRDAAPLLLEFCVWSAWKNLRQRRRNCYRQMQYQPIISSPRSAASRWMSQSSIQALCERNPQGSRPPRRWYSRSNGKDVFSNFSYQALKTSQPTSQKWRRNTTKLNLQTAVKVHTFSPIFFLKLLNVSKFVSAEQMPNVVALCQTPYDLDSITISNRT